MGWAEKIMLVLNVIETVFILNILWIIGFVVGLGVFGFFPATRALIQVAQKDIWTDDAVTMKKLVVKYYHAYRLDFIEVSKFTALYLLVYSVIWLDLNIVHTISTPIGMFLIIITFVFAAYIVMTNVYLLMSSTIRFQFKLIKQILVMPFALPLVSVIYLLFLIALTAVSIRYSFLLVFGYFSIAAIIGKLFLQESMNRKHLIF